MDLSVAYQKASNSDEAFIIAEKEITPEYIAKFKVSPTIEYNKEERVIEAVGRGFTLTLVFTETECEVSIKLSFLLKALKGKVLDGVQRKLEKHV